MYIQLDAQYCTYAEGKKDWPVTSQLVTLYLIGEDRDDFWNDYEESSISSQQKDSSDNSLASTLSFGLCNISLSHHPCGTSHSRDNLASPLHQPITTYHSPQNVEVASGTPLLPPHREGSTAQQDIPLPIGSPQHAAVHHLIHFHYAPLGPYEANEPVTSAITRRLCTSLQAA